MRIAVKIAGVSPLLMNRFTEESEAAVSNQGRKAVKSNSDLPREVATRSAYRRDDGQLYLPGPNLMACIVEAGKFHKVGRSKVTTQRSSLIPAGIMVEEIELDLGTDHFEVDSRPVVIPATGGRVMRHRARLDEWGFQFTLAVDDAMFSKAFVRELVDDAGAKIGLGDFRPDRKGPFGRFKVAGWE